MSRPVLLDTHTFIWYAAAQPDLPAATRRLVVAADVAYVSAASVWEVRTKHRLGKLPAANALVATGVVPVLTLLGCQALAVDAEDGDLAGSFPQAHRDPFDRMLAAQALRRNLALVSNDAALDAFGVTRVW